MQRNEKRLLFAIAFIIIVYVLLVYFVVKNKETKIPSESPPTRSRDSHNEYIANAPHREKNFFKI